jgi:hypothetical protein
MRSKANDHAVGYNADMAATASVLRLTGIAKKRIAQLRARAEEAGMSPEAYARRVLEEHLALEAEARGKTFAKILGGNSDGSVDDEELDALVDRARWRHHRKVQRKK